MTEKLFENDAYLWECEAVVTACEPCKNGFAVELDKTVFFPEGAGSSATAASWVRLPLRTWRKKAGAFCTFAISRLLVGSTVKAAVDGVVRLDHMQQHCGEHILSYAAWKLFGANNIGFHMSEGW